MAITRSLKLVVAPVTATFSVVTNWPRVPLKVAQADKLNAKISDNKIRILTP